MTVYILMALTMCALWGLFGWLEHTQRLPQSTARIAYLILATLLISAVAGARADSVGFDTVAYAGWFRSGSTAERFEFCYRLLFSLLSTVTNNSAIFLFVCSLLPSACVAYTSYRLSRSPYMSMLLYVLLYHYFFSLDVSRQYLAVGFLLVAFWHATNQKWIYYAIFQILAIGFHNTAACGLILVFLFCFDSPRVQRIKIVLLVFGSILLAVFWKQFLALAASVLPPYYAGYLDGDFWLIADGGGFRQTVVYGSIFASFLLTSRPGSEARRRFTLPMLWVVILSVFVMRSLIFERFLYYFETWAVYVVPEIYLSDYRFPDIRIRKVIFAAILAVCFAFMIYLLQANLHHVMPYVTSF